MIWPLGLALACSLLVAVPATAAPAPAARRPMTAEDLWAMQRVGSPALSPDGRHVAFTVTAFSMEKNKGNGDLYLVPADGSAPPRRLTWNEGSDGSPAWSPDGKRLAFVSKRGDDPAQLYLLPLDGGEAEAVTSLPVAASDPRWFPDGRRIAFLASTWPDLNADFDAVKKRLDARKDDKTKPETSETRILRYWDRYVTDGQVTHVFAVDLETRQVRDLLPGWDRPWSLESAAGEWDLAPDGREIAFSANATEPPYRTLDFNIFLQTLAPDGAPAGAPRAVTAANPADDTRPRYTPDGHAIVYGRTLRPENDADFTRLARYERTTGAVTGLAEDWDASPSGWTLTPDGRTILFHAGLRGRVGLLALPAQGGAPRRLVRGGTTSHVAAGPRGRLVLLQESITAPAELWALGLDGKNARQLTDFNRELLSQLDLGSVRDVTIAGAGGDSVQMFVVLPPGFDPARKWPLLQCIHGGPHGAWNDQFHYRWNAALFAARGHVAAFVNFHGSTGAGQAFCESILGAHGDKPFTDILMATDWLVAQGWVDETRLAAAGGSYGGYLVNWILGHTERFRALVSHAGVYDLMAQFASDATWGRPRNYGAAPWEDPERIDRWSPNRFAARFATPTLVLHGEKDYRVPVTQGLELYGVLQGKGVPARIVVFPDENHWILKPQAARLWWAEVFAWVEKHIGAGPETAAGAAPAALGARR